MKSRMMVAALALAMVFGAKLSADEAAKAEPKCPVSGKPVNMEKFVEFEGGKVYFCCGGCPGAFEKDSAKFAAKARHQMVLTGQLKQIHCPISHHDSNPDENVVVGGVTVTFCCEKCKGKVAGMGADEQVDACFGKADCFEAVEK
jgi:YHS domain-containing protein